jgi:hypothetical protein
MILSCCSGGIHFFASFPEDPGTHSITIAGSLPFPTALTPNVIVERGFPEYPSAQCTTPYPHLVTSTSRDAR